MVRLLFLALLCSLVLPRVAWSAHVAGHEVLATASAVHTHHGGHAHEHAAESSAEYDPVSDAENESDGLTHEHEPAFALGTAVILPDAVSLPARSISSEPEAVRESCGRNLKHPDSLLRPPRTI
jgi:hypothetical protein